MKTAFFLALASTVALAPAGAWLLAEAWRDDRAR